MKYVGVSEVIVLYAFWNHGVCCCDV